MGSTPSKPAGYGQYCPLALAAELLCRRWTILIVSRLIDGCRTFSEIHQGVPRISPSLLSTRLAELEYAGVLTKEKQPGEKRFRYEPTEACRDLEEVVNTMATWGQRWGRDMDLDDLDPGFLAFSMSYRMNTDAMPPGRTVIEFEFSNTPTEFSRIWLVCDDDKVDMCLADPGYESDVYVKSDLRRFVECWRGIRNLKREIEAGHVRLTGPRKLTSVFHQWPMLSMLAPVQRMAPGRESRIARG